MKNKLLTLISFSVLTLFLSSNLFAQVGINNVNPKATLDISASNVGSPAITDGVLIPRIDEFPASSPTESQKGMMVYVTGEGLPSKGFYFWDGGNWTTIDGGNNWGKNGNAGTTAGTNFIGTTDAQALSVFTNNTERLRISQGGHFRAFENGSATLPIFTWDKDRNTGIYRIGDDILGISTGGTERMRIDNKGNTGINTGANALSRLEVVEGSDSQGSIYSHITNTGSTWTALEGYNPNASGGAGLLGSGQIGVYGSGSVGVIGYGFSGVQGIPVDVVLDWAGYFFGDIGVNNDVWTTSIQIWSDERIKSNIVPVTNALDIITKLNPVTYDKEFVVERKVTGTILSNSNPKGFDEIPTQFEVSVDSEIGLLAQEVKAVLPQLVKEKKMNLSNKEIENLMSVNYIGLIPVLIKAVQEQQSEIEVLKLEIEALKN